MTNFAKFPLSKRNDQIDTLRAIACIGLVSYHVVGSGSGSGLELPDNHWLARLNLALVDLRMPLFSFLSGMVFDVPEGSFFLKVKAKSRRLLLPMAAVGTIFWFIREMMGYAQEPIYEIFFLPFAHFWFLQATFVIMLSCLIGTYICGGRSNLAIGIVGIVGAALYISPFRPEVNLFSIMNAWKLAPFFAAGFLTARSMTWQWSPDQKIIGTIGIISAAIFGAILAWDFVTFEPQMRRGVSVFLGLIFCLMLYMAKPNSSWLASIGRQSYAIYLFHVFFTASTIMTINYIFPALPPLVMLFLALLAGVFGPIILGNILIRNPITAFLFLGIKRKGPDREADRIAAPS